MSGGHWEYQQRQIEEQGRRVFAMHAFMAQAEHELDWGLCGDTCLRCAKLRVIAALQKYFDSPDDCAMPLAIMRDREQNRCKRCRREVR
jgi:hypothetical protein